MWVSGTYDLFSEECDGETKHDCEGDDTDAGRPRRKGRDERNGDVGQWIEVAADAAAELHQGVHADEEQHAELERGPRIGTVLMCVARTISEERCPDGDPCEVSPSERLAARKKETREQECSEQERSRQSPSRPRCAPYAKRCV